MKSSIKKTISVFAIVLSVLMISISPILATDTADIPSRPYLYVRDDANVLNDEEERKLNEKLQAYDRKTGNQIAVLLVRTTGNEPIEKYSYRIASAWGIGEKEKSNGILVTIATDDHKDRIEVGKGLESEVTDSRAGRILRSDEVTSAFRRGNWYEGTKSIVTQVKECIRTKGRSADYRTPLICWLLVLPLSVPLLISAICSVADLREEDRKKYRKRLPAFAGIALLEATLFVMMFIAPSAVIFFAAAAGTWILPFFAMMASATWQGRGDSPFVFMGRRGLDRRQFILAKRLRRRIVIRWRKLRRWRGIRGMVIHPLFSFYFYLRKRKDKILRFFFCGQGNRIIISNSNSGRKEDVWKRRKRLQKRQERSSDTFFCSLP